MFAIHLQYIMSLCKNRGVGAIKGYGSFILAALSVLLIVIADNAIQRFWDRQWDFHPEPFILDTTVWPLPSPTGPCRLSDAEPKKTLTLICSDCSDQYTHTHTHTDARAQNQTNIYTLTQNVQKQETHTSPSVPAQRQWSVTRQSVSISIKAALFILTNEFASFKVGKAIYSISTMLYFI